jgi:hypothetical protein
MGERSACRLIYEALFILRFTGYIEDGIQPICDFVGRMAQNIFAKGLSVELASGTARFLHQPFGRLEELIR